MKKKLMWQLVLIVGVITLMIIGYNINLLYFPTTVDEVLLTIERGESARTIASKLLQKGIIRNDLLFYLYVRVRGLQGSLDFGTYLFDGKLSMADVVEIIQQGKVKLNRITIPEGLTIRKTARLLAKKGFGDYATFRSLAFDTTFVRTCTGFNAPSLEGFLFPETYFFPDGVSEEFILKHMAREFFRQTASLDFKPNEHLSYYETITLASIVEKEARLDDEKPIIASVYLNRIEDNLKLQACPTVAYTLEQMGKSRKRLYYRDLEIDSPYNTYRNYGLPPTPICSPAKSTIEAVLNPAQTNYFFFFANNGRHVFSQTYDQHMAKQRTVHN
jgi:UPF0755 protein